MIPSPSRSGQLLVQISLVKENINQACLNLQATIPYIRPRILSVALPYNNANLDLTFRQILLNTFNEACFQSWKLRHMLLDFDDNTPETLDSMRVREYLRHAIFAFKICEQVVRETYDACKCVLEASASPWPGQDEGGESGPSTPGDEHPPVDRSAMPGDEHPPVDHSAPATTNVFIAVNGGSSISYRTTTAGPDHVDLPSPPTHQNQSPSTPSSAKEVVNTSVSQLRGGSGLPTRSRTQ